MDASVGPEDVEVGSKMTLADFPDARPAREGSAIRERGPVDLERVDAEGEDAEAQDVLLGVPEPYDLSRRVEENR